MRFVFVLVALLSVVAVAHSALSESEISVVQETLLDLEAEGASVSMIEKVKKELKKADGKSGLEGVIKLLNEMLRKYETLLAAQPVAQLNCEDKANDNDPYCEMIKELADLEKRIADTNSKIKGYQEEVDAINGQIATYERQITGLRGEITNKEKDLATKQTKAAADQVICDKKLAKRIDNINDAKRLTAVLESIKNRLTNDETGRTLMEVSSSLRSEAMQTNSKTMRNLLETAAIASSMDVKKDAKYLREVIDQLLKILQQAANPKTPRVCEVNLNAQRAIIRGIVEDIKIKSDEKDRVNGRNMQAIDKRNAKTSSLNGEKSVLIGLQKSKKELEDYNIQRPVLRDVKRKQYTKIIAFLKEIIAQLSQASGSSSEKTRAALREINTPGQPNQGQWVPGAWGSCGKNKLKKRTVRCYRGDASEWSDCDATTKPATERTCNTGANGSNAKITPRPVPALPAQSTDGIQTISIPGGGLSWTQSVAKAAELGGRLPTHAEIRALIASKGQKPLFSQDMWWPISDRTNDWVSVGSHEWQRRLGNSHTTMFGPPGWGSTSGYNGFRTTLGVMMMTKQIIQVLPKPPQRYTPRPVPALPAMAGLPVPSSVACQDGGYYQYQGMVNGQPKLVGYAYMGNVKKYFTNWETAAKMNCASASRVPSGNLINPTFAKLPIPSSAQCKDDGGYYQYQGTANGQSKLVGYCNMNNVRKYFIDFESAEMMDCALTSRVPCGTHIDKPSKSSI